MPRHNYTLKHSNKHATSTRPTPLTHTHTIKPKTHHTHFYKPHTHTSMKIMWMWCYKHSKCVAHWDHDSAKTTSYSYCRKSCGTLQNIIKHHFKRCKQHQELQHNQTWPLTDLRTMAYPLFRSQTPHKHCLAKNCRMGNATTAGVPRNCHRLCHHHLLHQCTLLLIILTCKVLECVVDCGTPAIACTSPYHDETKLNNHEFVHITNGWNKPLTQPTSLDKMKNLKLKCGTPNSTKNWPLTLPNTITIANERCPHAL